MKRIELENKAREIFKSDFLAIYYTAEEIENEIKNATDETLIEYIKENEV